MKSKGIYVVLALACLAAGTLIYLIYVRTHPLTLQEAAMPEPKWLDGYSGETVDELIALEGKYRTDSLVLAFEHAMDQKAARVGVGKLTPEERTILAIEALEREVNNGGYDQFFFNSSREYKPVILDALRRIGCPRTAVITQKALVPREDCPANPCRRLVVGDGVACR